jgi:signal transduction histidine kinase
MENAVSGLRNPPRIQTTPEIAQKTGGAVSESSRPPQVRRGRTYRTWPVFSLALLALLALMLVPALTALRRSEAIYEEIRASQQQFQSTQQIFERVSQNVFAISLAIREFLLDSSPDAGRTYRARVTGTREQLQADIARLDRVLPTDGKAALQQLRQEVDQYVAVVTAIFDWSAQQRVERGAYFLREEQRPRRETILAVTQQLSHINATVYAEQQRHTTDSEQWFRGELTDSVLFALLTGVIVSAAGILRMRWLERRAAEQRHDAEETTEEIRQLSIRLRHAQEEERRTISRELHDEVGQKLTAMRMELGTLEGLRRHEGEFESRLAEVKALAEQSLHSIRDLAAGLRPAVLDDLGLPAAVQKQAREFSMRTGVKVTVSVDGPFNQLIDPHRTYIYRIVQEALTNCAKHAKARQIDVALADRGDRVELSVTDDGVGFSRERGLHTGLGVIGMEERVRELGGVIVVNSTPEHGTMIHASIPLPFHGSDSRSPR